MRSSAEESASSAGLRWAKRARAFTWFCLLATLLGYVGHLFWLFDLFAEFRLQWAVLGVGSSLAWARRKKWTLVGVGAATLALNLVAITPLYHREQGPMLAEGTMIRVVQANLFYKNPDVGRIRAFLEREDAHFVCVYEFSGDQKDLIPWLEARYPYHVDAPLVGGARSAMYSRFPLRDTQRLQSAFTLREGVRTTAEIDGRLVDFFVAHPTIPLYPGAANGRNGQLEEISKLAVASRHPSVMVGDFNITPFSAFYPPKKHSELRDMGEGLGPLPTFPSVFPPLTVPIDHMFATKGIRASSRRLGPFIGSDHFPIVTDLVIPNVP